MTQLNSPEDYFLNVLKPNNEAFFNNPSTFANALNLATSLFHFHEWIHAYARPGLEAHYGQTIASPGALWGIVEQANKNFGYIRDLSNASKHVMIDRKTSTSMSHIANTHIFSTGFGMGGFGQGRYGGGPNVVFDDGGAQISFDQCASDLFTYWKQLLQTLTGKVYL